MRSHEERLAAVKQRIAQEEQRKRIRRIRVTTVCSAAACFAVIVGLSVLMPGIVQNMTVDNYSVFETAASIFGGGAVMGHLIIGLVAFLLGICVTILCFRLRKFRREDGEKEKRDDRTR